MSKFSKKLQIAQIFENIQITDFFQFSKIIKIAWQKFQRITHVVFKAMGRKVA